MRRGAAILALTAAAALLGGCVYDPYTRTMAPCCGYYGNPYGYRYAPPYPQYGTLPPYGTPPSAQPGAYSPPSAGPGAYPSPYAQPGAYPPPSTDPGTYPPPSAQPGPYPGAYQGPSGAQGGTLAQRFTAANVTGDGRLTRQQAASGMPRVAENYDAIDLDRKGYVTLPEIRTFIARQQAAGGPVGQFDTD
jgi:hypothetical protein